HDLGRTGRRRRELLSPLLAVSGRPTRGRPVRGRLVLGGLVLVRFAEVDQRVFDCRARHLAGGARLRVVRGNRTRRGALVELVAVGDRNRSGSFGREVRHGPIVPLSLRTTTSRRTGQPITDLD